MHNTLRIKSLAFLGILLFASTIHAQSFNGNLAVKLAILHEKARRPEVYFLNQKIKPERAVIHEFQWIMDGLKNRCLNPETAIADTLVETWQKLKIRQIDISLLETSRRLSNITRNKKLFGTNKVNIRMTANYWLKTSYPELF